jgi:hypothetical protein
MKPAQAKHNEALGMRVTSHEPSVFPSGGLTAGSVK